jgi:hypothetical protein
MDVLCLVRFESKTIFFDFEKRSSLTGDEVVNFVVEGLAPDLGFR